MSRTENRLRLLKAAGLAEAAREPLSVADLALELDVSKAAIVIDLDDLAAQGLVLHALEEGLPPVLLMAGRQYLGAEADVPYAVLRFLPRVIDDLHAREALLVAGTIVVDEFRAAILDGDPVGHARKLVPPAFVSAVDERLALDLYAATVARMARLSGGAPGGWVAEVILSVSRLEQARVWLELRHDEGKLGADEAQVAGERLRDLFELFEDDDVLSMFEMGEPGDAAMAGHDPINQQLGVVDQRVEAWFDAFGGTSPTGYLSERPSLDL